MGDILVFGTSITYGAWDAEGGWVARFRKYLDGEIIGGSTSEHLIYNLGISGDNTENVLEHFDTEVKARLEDQKPTILFSVGTNDSQYVNATQQNRVSPEEFEENLKKLIRMAKKYSYTIIFTGIIPVDDGKMDPIPWAPEKSYKNEYIEQYDGIIQKACKEEGAGFIEMYKAFKDEDYKGLLFDGVHPNAAGHEKMFDIIKEYLEEKGVI